MRHDRRVAHLTGTQVSLTGHQSGHTSHEETLNDGPQSECGDSHCQGCLACSGDAAGRSDSDLCSASQPTYDTTAADLLATVDAFTQGYLECALWSSTDESTEEGGDPLDANYGLEDFDLKCLEMAIADCVAFQKANRRDLRGLDAGQCGHDFWLTRNGHGAGFWDRNLAERGYRLTAACKAYGSVDLYVYAGLVCC